MKKPLCSMVCACLSAGPAQALAQIITNQAPPQPPTITTQPTQVVSATDQSFRVTADGDPPLRYYWYADGLPITRTTNGTLSILHSFAGDGTRCKVVVSNAVGRVASQNAVLTVPDS